VIGGILNLPFTTDTKFLEHWLVGEEGWRSIPFEAHLTLGTGEKVTIAVLSIITALIGVVAAFVVYQKRREPADRYSFEALKQAWFIDSTYARIVDGPGRWLFDAVAWFDRTVVDGAVNGVAWLAKGAGTNLRTVQNGLVRSYAMVVAIGAFILVAYVLVRMSF
jgi:NADH-quinone oxidoreductase subunit L